MEPIYQTLMPDLNALNDVVLAHDQYDPPGTPLVLDSQSVPYVPEAIELSVYESEYDIWN